MLAQGTQLAQTRLASATASTIYTATLRTEVTTIFVCNVTGSASSFRLYHDDDGTTYDETSALYWDASIPANSTVNVCSETDGAGISIKRSGNLGFRPGDNNALNVTVYGVTEQIAV